MVCPFLDSQQTTYLLNIKVQITFMLDACPSTLLKEILYWLWHNIVKICDIILKNYMFLLNKHVVFTT